ncbi:MAG: glycosyltransferase family 2 protein [Candidatus Wildermuthbacteria bacterium]|nr:glycosyltransferase family 2 protein [Candidatus Wildermuthbacteria bacterium]
MRLSVIIPAYNEESRIAKTLRSASQYLRNQTYEYEIIVVDGGSKDNTVGLVQQLKKEIPYLNVLQVENKGKGYAVKQGMLESHGEYCVFMDADNSTTVDHVEKMWSSFQQGSGVVIGSRDIEGAVIAVPQPGWRIFLGNVFNIIVQVMSGLWGMWDTQCGFKGFSRKAVRSIFPKSRINGWAFDVEILMIAKSCGFEIEEIPVTWVNDPDSKVKFSGMVKMLFEVLFARWNMLIGKYAER